MEINKIAHLIKGEVISCKASLSKTLNYGFASDLMSDVLTLDTESVILITGLSNVQVIRTAEMSDISCVIIARNKKVSEQMINLAEENDIVIIKSSCTVFKVVGELFCKGIKALY
ncbi:MAG: DRTGG domain-containing protein [Bacteroidales bacterium]|jgi:predicted transcriptional regulator|nr:DRTGG domain-containing protein [Bacteroidales bacterium]